MNEIERFKQIIDRLRELQAGKLGLSQETLRDLDRYFREKINELTPAQRDAVQDYYIQTL